MAQPSAAGHISSEDQQRTGRPLPPRSPWELAEEDDLFDEPGADPAAADPEPMPPAGTTSLPDSPPGSGRNAPQALGDPTVRQAHQVSLGAGIALVGLGLGFLALRLRRVN
ncbi:hypothetical protein [Streptomyces sp. PTD5-9]|uniref:hypothetical protein n=1 Tax=Streptomyces sp. PTD5-9 TaxID=3120150 RepID=UPI003009A775